MSLSIHSVKYTKENFITYLRKLGYINSEIYPNILYYKNQFDDKTIKNVSVTLLTSRIIIQVIRTNAVHKYQLRYRLRMLDELKEIVNRYN